MPRLVVNSSGQRRAWLFLALAPWLLLLWAVVRYRVDVLWGDQWAFVPYVEAFFTGKLRLQHFWLQHQEHRPVFMRLIMLLLALPSGWNVSYEIAANVLLGSGLAAAVFLLARRTVRRVGGLDVGPLIALLSCIVFSLNQYENWIWGWQIQIFLNALGAAGVAILLAHPSAGWRRFILAALCGIVATYSFANGLLVWAIGLLVLVMVSGLRAKEGRWRVALWLVIAGLVYLSYFPGYVRPPCEPPVGWSVMTPFRTFFHGCVYLGGPIVPYAARGAAIAGFLGVALFAASIWWLRRRGVGLPSLAPFVALGCYAIGSAVITALGRSHNGPRQALASRYITFANFLWISEVILLFLVSGFRARSATRETRRVGLAAGFLLVTIAALSVVGSLSGIRGLRDHYNELLLERQEILWPRDEHVLGQLCFQQIDFIRSQVDVLKKYRLSVFRRTSPGIFSRAKLEIAGTIRNADGGPTSGFRLETPDDVGGFAVTDSQGKYALAPSSFQKRYGWTGRVAPWKAGGYVFAPAFKGYVGLATDTRDRDFTARRIRTTADLVRYFYQRLLLRDPEPGAVKSWLNGGVPKDTGSREDAHSAVRAAVRAIVRSLLTSKEYVENRHRPDSDFFVDCFRIYVLRDPTPAEMSDLLRKRRTRSELIGEFERMPEFEKAVDDLFPFDRPRRPQ